MRGCFDIISMNGNQVKFMDSLLRFEKMCTSESMTQHQAKSTVLPAKSDSDVIFVYKVIRDL